jgi:hypothetical protein
MPEPKESNYQILPTPNMGLGMVASRDIKMGDLILAERPLIVLPKSPYLSPFVEAEEFDWEKFIQPCFERLTPERQAAYRALANSHTRDGSEPLLGIVRTNGFGIPLQEGFSNTYTGVYNELSRINHR